MRAFCTYLTLFLILLMANTLTTSRGVNIPPKIHVQVINALESGVDLELHCMSKDDDLGVHVLRLNETFSFHFRTKFFGGTLFHCAVRWDGVVRRFVAYERNKDSCERSQWSLKVGGPCLKYLDFPYKAPVCIKWK